MSLLQMIKFFHVDIFFFVNIILAILKIRKGFKNEWT